jgi:hypothetical protein
MIGVLEWGFSVRSAEGGGDSEQDADAELATDLTSRFLGPFLTFGNLDKIILLLDALC